MKKFYVLFKYKGKEICGRWMEGTDEEDAISKASWHLICHYPNVKFDNAIVTLKE